MELGYVTVYTDFRTDQVTRYASHYNNAAQSLSIEPAPRLKLRSLLAEACWSTGRLEDLRDILDGSEEEDSSDFNIGVAKILLAMQQKDLTLATTTINNLRGVVAKNLNSAAVSSLQTCHDTLLRLHIVYEMGVLGGVSQVEATDNILPVLHSTLEKRLAVIGSYIADKQYLLGIRRAVMQVSEYVVVCGWTWKCNADHFQSQYSNQRHRIILDHDCLSCSESQRVEYCVPCCPERSPLW